MWLREADRSDNHMLVLSTKMLFEMNSTLTLEHLYFAVTQTNGTMGTVEKVLQVLSPVHRKRSIRLPPTPQPVRLPCLQIA